jgi:hypothetical protein
MNLRRMSPIAFLVAAFVSQLCSAQENQRGGGRSSVYDAGGCGSIPEGDGKTVKVIYSSSGNFLEQIQNGAPLTCSFSEPRLPQPPKKH